MRDETIRILPARTSIMQATQDGRQTPRERQSEEQKERKVEFGVKHEYPEESRGSQLSPLDIFL
jgi:hypothetical protein